LTNTVPADTVSLVTSSASAATILRELLHEIRTPLAALVALGELCDVPANPAHDAAVEHINAMVRRADAQLRGDSSTLANAASRLVIGDVLAETVSLLGAAQPDGRIEVSGQLGQHVLADRVALTQILVNLLVNALRYAPAQTAVNVVVSVDGPCVHVLVCDQGPGVDPVVGDRVFDSGVTDGHAGGSGLGLFLARRLAASMNGELRLGGQELGGCLILALPVA
jgi:signal transduction histidine kinase